MSGERTTPPSIAKACLNGALPRGVRGETIVGDLQEEYAHRCARLGALAAGRWYRRQVARVIFQYALPHRIRGLIDSLGRHTGEPFRSLPHDGRSALCSLAAVPALAVLVIVILGLGIGASTAMFSVLDAVLLRALPFADPPRTVQIWSELPERPGRAMLISDPDFIDYRQRTRSFDRIAALGLGNTVYSSGARVEEFSAPVVSGQFFDIAPVTPALGRTLEPRDDEVLEGIPMMISHEIWQERFGGSPDVLGEYLTLRRWVRPRWAPFEARVVGVLPASYELPPLRRGTRYSYAVQPHLILGLGAMEWGRGDRDMRKYAVLATLAEGISARQARDDLASVAAGIEAAGPGSSVGSRVKTQPVESVLYRQYGRPLLAAQAACVLLLLISCANVAGLLFGRGAVRQRELAVRAALGAGRVRLCRQLLIESLALSGGGYFVGLAMAAWLTTLATTSGAMDAFRVGSARLDGRAMIFAAAISLLAALAFGIGPAIRATRPRWLVRLGSGGGGLRFETLRSLRYLVVGQVAAALVLLVGAGLMVSSLANLLATEVGVRYDSLLRAELVLPPRQLSAYGDAMARDALLREIRTKLEALPGIETVGAADESPLGAASTTAVTIPRPQGDPLHEAAERRWIDSAYFRAAGVPLVDGRLPAPEHWATYERDPELQGEFAAWDWTGRGAPLHLTEEFLGTPLPVWISATMARRFWPEASAVGRLFFWGHQDPAAIAAARVGDWDDDAFDRSYPYPRPLEVVGIVADKRSANVREQPPPQYYTLGGNQIDTLLIRARGHAPSLYRSIRETVQAVDPAELTVASIRSMSDVFDDVTASVRYGAFLAVAVGLAAALLTAVGLLGVLGFAVSQRHHEFGVRVSVGARAGDIKTLVIRDGARLVGLGLLIGLIVSLLSARTLASLLYEVSPTSPPVLALAAALVAGVGLAASALPAVRAGRVDPVRMLRQDE